MDKPGVTVIIPCYNSSRFISKTIDSVFNQTYENLEIVAIDDGSKDETREILKGYLPKIRILHHPGNANLGEGASMNLAIIETESDLIAFLDHDDIWYPNKIKEQVGVFQKYPDVALVYTNGYVIGENDNILYNMLPDDFREENVPGKILLNCYIRTTSSVMVRRNVLNQIGSFNTDLYTVDHELWVRISEVARFFYLPEYLTGYRSHGAGQKSLSRKMWEDEFILLREACKRYPYGVDLKRRRLAVLYYRLGEFDWNHNDYFRAVKNYFLAGILDPFRAVQRILNKAF
jgi:glycosyltransferase involved in cell wall biosynthesis